MISKTKVQLSAEILKYANSSLVRDNGQGNVSEAFNSCSFFTIRFVLPPEV